MNASRLLCFFFLLLHWQQPLHAQQMRVGEEEVNLEAMFIEALKEKSLGNLEKAISQLQKIQEADDKNATVHYELARLFLVQNKYNQALEQAERAVSLDKTNAWYTIMMADVYDKLGRYTDCIRIYQELADQYPRQSKDYLMTRSGYQIRNGDPQGALATYEQIEKRYGVSEDILSKKVGLYLQLRMVDKAIATQKSLVQYAPHELAYQYQLGLMLEEQKDKTGALAVFKNILARYPEEGKAMVAISRLEGNASAGGNKYAGLIQTLKNPSVDLDLKIKEAIPAVQELAQTGNQSIAKSLLEVLPVMDQQHPQQAKVKALWADVYYHSGQPDKALPNYQQAVTLDPTVYTIWDQYFVLLEAHHDIAELHNATHEAADLFPNQSRILYFQGIAFFESGDYNKAISAWKQALVMSRKNLSLTAELHARTGEALYRLNQDSAGEEAFNKAEQVVPGMGITLALQVRTALWPWENWTTAEKAAKKMTPELQKKQAASMKARIEQSRRLAPGQPLPDALFGRVLLLENDVEGALAWMEKVCTLPGYRDPQSLEIWGDLLLKKGKTNEAFQAWEQALDAGALAKDRLQEKLKRKGS